MVVPCFNDGPLLNEALESVNGQERCELVVVDDGSDDKETRRILQQLADSGVHVVRQPNAGLSAARMTGVRETTARYIHPLDADDKLAPGALTALADLLDSDPNLDAAWGDYRTFGASTYHVPTAPVLDAWRITYISECLGTSMVSRRAIEATGGWSMGSGYEDWDFWMSLAEHGFRGRRVSMVTLLYRQHGDTRMYRSVLGRHDELFTTLRSRHKKLFDARSQNRRASRSPVGIKIAFSLVDSLPGLSAARKAQLYALARYLVQPDMASDGFRGPVQRLRDRL